MPIQAPQWTDYLNCPVCCREFGLPPRSPISLGCSHTICKQCLDNLHNKQCPFDQTTIETDLEELVVNTALLQLAGHRPPMMPHHPPSIEALPENERRAYDTVVQCLEQLALYLYCSNGNNGAAGSRLSRPMQRKLVTLFQCALSDNESRVRAVRAARSLGERTVTELILQHQNSQQLSANLWAAVRARGCQFLGPAMQEEVLKLVLLALEDGSALSRKVLVMFVVQRLEPHFPQASKTSIGHVVQLLYRASCFKVSKRECDSSLMQLKDEFRTYDALRREHDAQIVQIATEAGLRIAPDQWSSLLYGDTAHKSHMQSIIDKLQTPQSFAQSIQELYIALQRTGDMAQLVAISRHLNYLANIDVNADIKIPTWGELAEIYLSLKEVISCLHFNNHFNDRDGNCAGNQNGIDQAGRVINLHMMHCKDACFKDFCPRGNLCPYWHAEDDLDRVENDPGVANDDGTNKHAVPLAIQIPAPMPIGAIPQQMSQRQITPQFVQPIPLPLPPHLRLAPIRLPPGMTLPPHVSLAGPMYAHYPVATTVPPKYNCVPPVAAVPMMQPNGAMMRPNVAMMQPNGAMMQPNGAMMQANNPMMPPNSAVMQPNGAMMQPKAAMMQPNGAMMQPNAAMMQPNGAMMQPNGAIMQNPSGPLWFNPFYGGYYPHTDGNCYPTPEYVPGGVMVPPGGYQNFEASQPSAGGNAFVSPPYDTARASPYNIDGGHAEGSPDYNISPFNYHLNNVNQVQGAWAQHPNVYNYSDMRNAVDEIFAGPTSAANNLVAPQSAADLESSDEKELEEEMQALEIRIGAVLKGSE